MFILKGEPYETSLGVYITVSFAQNMVKLVPEGNGGTAKNVILFLLIRLIKQSMILSTLFCGYLVKMYKNLCRKTVVVFVGKYLSFGKYGLCRLKLRVR